MNYYTQLSYTFFGSEMSSCIRGIPFRDFFVMSVMMALRGKALGLHACQWVGVWIVQV
jgi:hypothetical protein